MKNKSITHNISAGMYVLTTNNAGCMVDAVSQISMGDNPLISVAVNKNNYTNKKIRENKKFALSILGMDLNYNIIETFGMKSSKDINKFENMNLEKVLDINVIKDSTGYMVCELVDIIDAETHDLFIGRIVEADKYNGTMPMTYNYYQENREDLVKKKTESGKTAWVCTVCGYVYYGEELPKDFICPICKVPANMFKKM